MRVDQFDFELPEKCIALRPVEPRDSAKLLCVDAAAELNDRTIADFPDLLRPGDALVFNDTRVIPAQLHGVRLRDGAEPAKISATLHMRMAPDRWKAFARGAKKLREGDRLDFGNTLSALVTEKDEDGEITLQFTLAGGALDFALAKTGHMPLPPYIASKRGQDARDRSDYQTIYAKKDGAVAAPTAGLHFTDQLFTALDQKGIEKHFVTLHVGAGTFLPVKADDTDAHKMHAEIGIISEETAIALNSIKKNGGRIVAVGTTSLRLLESAVDQSGILQPFDGATDIFITPGYHFGFVDMLLTNFHLPRSTLFMLVAAFTGLKTMQAAYAHAIKNHYRFYSYGDACLLYRRP